MEFGWSEGFESFRAEVRAFVREFKTPELERELAAAEPEEAASSGPIAMKIRDEIEQRGWMRMCWPPELGGEGKSPWYQYILVDELQKGSIPYSLGTASMIGPAVMKFGTEEQKAKYLPGLWSGEITCALGYSEPNAGTDLASLETAATRDGDDWVINGQKLWTSGAHRSSHVWLAARTDPDAPKHRGISMFIVPLDSPGITVRPVWVMSGGRTNETFYDNVRIPADALIGEEGRGWYIAANALDHERVSFSSPVRLEMLYDRLIRHVSESRPDLIADQATRAKLAELKVEVHVARALGMTNAALVANGETPTMEASMGKVWNTELRYRMSSLAMDLLGRAGALSKGAEWAPLDGEFDTTYRGSPVGRFGGGTNEIQRNIIAERGLGLPRG